MAGCSSSELLGALAGAFWLQCDASLWNQAGASTTARLAIAVRKVLPIDLFKLVMPDQVQSRIGAHKTGVP